MGPKPGYRTSEFWLTLAVDAGALIAALADKLPPRWAAIASTVSTGLYAVARGWTKSNPALPSTTSPPPPPPAA